MDKIQEAVNEQVNELLKQRVGEAVQQLDIPAAVNKYLQTRFDNPNFRQFVGKQVLESVEGLNVSGQTLKLIDTKVNNAINSQVSAIQQLVRNRVDLILTQTIEQLIRSFSFPEASINPSAIEWKDFKFDISLVSGSHTHKGLEDLADKVELTILDDNVVVENNFITKQIKADSILTNELSVGQGFWNEIETLVRRSIPVYESFDSKPLEDKLTDLQQEVNEVRVQNKHPQLKELEVSGESLLSDVLYTTPGNKRVGINTMDPSDALTVWDQEAEVVIGKYKSQEGYIGTRRRQALNIGSNNKVGIRVDPDGKVQIDKLVLAGRNIGVTKGLPGDAAKKGDIRLNEDPKPGDPIGWVCIDGIRWSAFGRIE